MTSPGHPLSDNPVEFLARLPYFSGLTPAELARVQERLVPVSYRAGQVIFFDGEPCPGLFIVVRGRVRVFKASSEGREQVLLLAGPGDSFNEVPIFDGGPNPATAQAIEPSQLWLLPRDDLLALLQEYPAIVLGVLRVFADRLRHLMVMVEDLSFRGVTARVAKLLLQMAEAGGPPSGRRLTQQQMAALVGTSREVVGRSLKALERDGLIQLQGHRVVVLRPEALRDII